MISGTNVKFPKKLEKFRFLAEFGYFWLLLQKLSKPLKAFKFKGFRGFGVLLFCLLSC